MQKTQNIEMIMQFFYTIIKFTYSNKITILFTYNRNFE